MDLQLVNSASPVLMCTLDYQNLAVTAIVATRNGCTHMRLAYCIYLTYLTYLIDHIYTYAYIYIYTFVFLISFSFDIANVLHGIPVYHTFSVTERVGARNGKPCKLPNVCFLET